MFDTNNKDYFLSKEEFDYIYSKVPRLTIEIILKNDEGKILLTKRAIEPCIGQWHLPGGTVAFGESLKAAVLRVAKRELSIKVKESINVGYIEYPSHYLAGLDYPVGIVFEVISFAGQVKLNQESQNSGWFNHLPKNMHADQDVFLIKNRYLKKVNQRPLKS